MNYGEKLKEEFVISLIIKLRHNFDKVYGLYL